MAGTAPRTIKDYERKDVAQFRRLTPNRHGPGAPEGNENRLRHGFFANRCLSQDERFIFDEILGGMQREYAFDGSADFIQVELAAIYFVKLRRALEHGDVDAASKINGMLRGHLKDLRLEKAALDQMLADGSEKTTE